jgi:hypothetical protein
VALTHEVTPNTHTHTHTHTHTPTPTTLTFLVVQDTSSDQLEFDRFDEGASFYDSNGTRVAIHENPFYGFE